MSNQTEGKIKKWVVQNVIDASRDHTFLDELDQQLPAEWLITFRIKDK